MLWIDDDAINLFICMLECGFLGWLLCIGWIGDRNQVKFLDFSETMLFYEFLRIIGALKTFEIYIVGSLCCSAIFCKFSWILDAYFMSYEFLIESTL